MHGARSIYIYRLAPCTENCSQKISKTFSHNNLEDVLLFCTFEPKKCKCAFRVAVSACTLKILCCGYNMATIKKDKKIKDYDTRSCSEMVIFLSLRFTQANESLSYNNLGTFSLSPFFLWSTFWPISWPTFWPAFYSEDANKTLRICFSCKYFCTNKMVFTNRRCESYKLFSNNK